MLMTLHIQTILHYAKPLLITSYSPVCPRPSLSLQWRMIGSHSVFELGIPSTLLPFILTSLTSSKAFLKAVIALVGRDESDVSGRWYTSIGVLFNLDRVGYDRSGPEIVTIEPNARGSPCFAFVIRSSSDCHHIAPNSAATLPPCANPKKWICAGFQVQCLVRWPRSLDKCKRAGVGFGLSIISPRGENEVYHWKACSYRNGILYVFTIRMTGKSEICANPFTDLELVMQVWRFGVGSMNVLIFQTGYGCPLHCT